MVAPVNWFRRLTHLAQPPNYRYQKKQREAAKKKKNEEKRQRREPPSKSTPVAG
jgi:hypothetical protein